MGSVKVRRARVTTVDDDNLSTTSTQEELFLEDGYFPVERILAEEVRQDSMYYLVYWSGHPEEESTWEPECNIECETILQSWTESKMRQSKGIEAPFDLSEFNARVEKLKQNKAKGRRRQKSKRKRVAMPVPSSKADSDDSFSIVDAMKMDDSRGDDRDMKSHVKIRPQKPKNASKVRTTKTIRKELDNLFIDPDEAPRLPGNKVHDGLLSDATHIMEHPVVGDTQEKVEKEDEPRKRGLSDDSKTSEELSLQREREVSEHNQSLSRSSKEVPPGKQRGLPKTLFTTDQQSISGNQPSLSKDKSTIRRSSSRIHKNVFEITEPPKRRRTLLDGAADPTKEKKHFSNLRLVRKAELAGRAVADAAPDIANLPGGLFDPSNPTPYQPLTTGNLRKHTPAIFPQQDLELQGDDSELDNAEGSTSMRIDSLSIDIQGGATRYGPPHRQDPYDAICYYWFERGDCTKGETCRYLHYDPGNVPVAPQPKDRADRKLQTCKFWARGTCYQSAETCQYLHANSVERTTPDDVPSMNNDLCRPLTVGSSTKTLRRTKSVTFAIDDPIPADEPAIPPSTIPVTAISEDKLACEGNSEVSVQTCRHWARGQCYHGATCWYLHGEPTASSTQQAEVEVASQKRGEAANNLDQIQHLNEIVADAVIQPACSPVRRQASLPDASSTEISNNELVSKVCINDCRRKRASKALGIGAKDVIFGADQKQSIVVEFGGLENERQHPWVQSFSALSKLQFDQMCNAQDFQAQLISLQQRIFCQGSLASDATDLVGLRDIDRIAEYLRLRSAGLVCAINKFIIIIYPARYEEWKFLEVPINISADVRLRYLVIEGDLNIKELRYQGNETEVATLQAKSGTCCREALVNSQHGVQLKRVIPQAKDGQDPYNFYLIFPSAANGTADFVSSWLQAFNKECRIYTSQTEGSWDFFVNSPSIKIGVVLIHEFAAASISKLPSLLNLFARNRNFSFWCIADSCSPYPVFPSYSTSNDLSLGQITTTRLFPHGHAICVTPSFLIAEPEKAYELLQWFYKMSLATTPWTWKLVCCYKFQEYLLDLALDKACERDEFYAKHHDKPAKDALAVSSGVSYQQCELRFATHRLVVDLLKRDILRGDLDYYDIDPADSSNSPMIYADRYIDQNNEYDLVSWFAGWSLSKLDIFRRFTVVGIGSASIDRAGRLRQVAKGKIDSTKEQQHALASEAGHEAPHSFIDSPESSDIDPTKSIVVEPVLSPKQKALAVAKALSNLSPSRNISAKTAAQTNIVKDGGALLSPKPSISSSPVPARTHLHRKSGGSAGATNGGTGSEYLPSTTEPLHCEDIDMRATRSANGELHSSEKVLKQPSRLSNAKNSTSHSNKVAVNRLSVNLAMERMEIDTPARCASIPERELEKEKGRDAKVMEKIQLEATTAWYSKRKAAGEAWEHIYVESWEKCFGLFGVRK